MGLLLPFLDQALICVKRSLMALHSRVPRRGLIVTKCNGAKIAIAQSGLIDLEKPLLQGF